ncbi:FAD-binding oxidoreductase [Pseudanabaena sp. FACHB-2040]|uniref:FAD-binding oxidoreductase n=1 Tax=Pseudanabaena sp. FACHB-2040 TaxID=2692859 RepID=UPI001689C991|nr:FAD-binding oxidoreductase [Pseudanabaena sp. FACHB-2040]MBD2261179.1 FAD-binding oxidoreductase [Pseudanabaena sp. FACHB-2040]
MSEQYQRQHDYKEALEILASRIRGELILPDSPAYAAGRKVWNGSFDSYPAAIVRCVDAEDVKVAVNIAREHAMTLSVRSGGHSAAGHGINTGGLVIDLSQMKTMTIDPLRHTARLEPGLTWGEVAKKLQPYGLALTAGDVASVGVGGLLLSGGIGWMVRAYGLTIDRLQAVELVTADGQLVRASADENPELFWGLRGGGGNFGVATAFEVNLHRGGTILGGAVFYEATEAKRILQEYTRLAAAAPDELSTEVLFMLAPPAPFIPPDKQGTPVVGIMVCYTGDISEGERVVAPLRQLATPVADLIAPMPYSAIFALTAVGEIPGFQHHSRSQFFETFSDEMIHTLVEASQSIVSPETLISLRVLGGAMSRVRADATAFAHRDKQGMVLVTHFAPLSADAASLDARTQRVFRALLPYANGAYVGFLADEGERIREVYPPDTYARLVALKNQYDPTNLFHRNQNIKPTATPAMLVTSVNS